MLRPCRLRAGVHSMQDLVRTVMYNYHHDILHELPDEHLMSFGRIRQIPSVGTRDDILARLYKCILKKESVHSIQIFSYDLEFTGTPKWDGDTPDQEIVEMAAFHPASGQSYSRLVKPTAYRMNEEAACLTKLTHETLEAEGVPFGDAFSGLIKWVGEREPNTNKGTQCMFVSHGGFLHDVRMLRYYASKCGAAIPPEFFFADSYRLIRETTRSKSSSIPNAKLGALMEQFNIVPLTHHHRALSDAIATWEVLQSAVNTYGNKHLTATEQVTKKYMQWRKAEVAKGKGFCPNEA